MVETLLPTRRQSEREVAVHSLGEGGQHHQPVRHERHKHGQQTQTRPDWLHAQADESQGPKCPNSLNKITTVSKTKPESIFYISQKVDFCWNVLIVRAAESSGPRLIIITLLNFATITSYYNNFHILYSIILIFIRFKFLLSHQRIRLTNCKNNRQVFAGLCQLHCGIYSSDQLKVDGEVEWMRRIFYLFIS